jgi:hypothetical protein
MIYVHGPATKRILEKHYIRIAAGWRQHAIENRDDHQRHSAFRERHNSQENDSDDQADFVRPDESQQPLQLR